MAVKKNGKAPAFTSVDKNGKKVSLKNFLGKWVVLYFYPKDSTPGCTVEAIEFTAAKKEFAKLGAVILGVSPDSPESHCRFTDKQNLGITLLSDGDKKLCEKYAVWQKKKMAGREYMGVVRSTFLIDPKGKIAEIWEKVKVKDHVKKVKEKLQELK